MRFSMDMDVDDIDIVERDKVRFRRGWRDKSNSGNFRARSCSTKRRFPDEARAKDFRSGLRMSGVLKNELRIYHCAFCNGFHLTHGAEAPAIA